jgi:TPR repeat protein
MHLNHRLTMLNSGLGSGTPGSTWAEPWPHWPPLEPIDKELLEARYVCGNIVAGALLAATVIANHIIGVGSITPAEHASALQTLKKIADLGDAAAPSYIGLALAQPGAAQDIIESTRYYRMAVERGNKNAPAVLGNLMLQHGGDAVQCVDLFKLSIARGGRYGHRFLADVLYQGAPGVPQDRHQALLLYEDAARLGDPVAKMKAVAATNGTG